MLNLGLTSMRITGMVFLKEEGFGRAGVLEQLAVLGDLSAFHFFACLPLLTRVKASSSINVK